VSRAASATVSRGQGGPVTRPADRGTAILARLEMELRLTARRAENVLVTAVIPAAVLMFFSWVPVFAPDDAGGRAVDRLLPGTLALAVIATGLVSLGIATAYERHYGVLKRLGGSPLGRAELVVAKLGAVLVVELVQVAALIVIAVGPLGWRPDPSAAPSAIIGAAGLGLGTAAFAGMGLLLAGALRAEVTLAVANALFLGFLLLGGVVVPLDRLPDPIGSAASVLPSAALIEIFRAALGGAASATAPDPGTSLLILTAWAIGAVVLAARSFRWE